MPGTIDTMSRERAGGDTRSSPTGGVRFAGLTPLFGLLSLLLYLRTASSTIGFGDSGEFVTAAATLGVAHPPAYPLYVMLAKLFTLLPVRTVAFRVNLFSACCAAATVALTFRFAARVLDDARGAAVAACLLAVSNTFWAYAIYAKNYALNALFLMLTLNLILWVRDGRRPHRSRWIRFAALMTVVGLSLANHYQSVMVTLPACAVLLLGHGNDSARFVVADILPPFMERLGRCKRSGIAVAAALWSGLLVMPGLLLYLYLPIRAAAQPFIDWGAPTTFERFWAALTMHDFTALHGPGSAFAWLARLCGGYVPLLLAEFTLPALPLAAYGLLYLRRASPQFFFASLTLYCSIVMAVTAGYNAPVDRFMTQTLSGFFIPAHMMVALWAGAGATALLQWSGDTRKSRRPRSVMRFAIALMLVGLPLFVMSQNLPANDRANDSLAEDYGWNVLSTVPKDAVIITQGHHDTFPLWYWQGVHRYRSDVAVVFADLLVWPWYREQLGARYGLTFPALPATPDVAGGVLSLIRGVDGRRPLYLDYFAAKALQTLRLPLQGVGLLFRLDHRSGADSFDTRTTLQLISQTYRMRGLVDTPKDATVENCLAPYAFMHDELAASYDASGNLPEAIEQWSLAAAISSQDVNARAGLARALARRR